MKEEREPHTSPVKPADALGTLSNRTRVSRYSGLLVAVVGFFVIAFFIGLLFRFVFDESNTPDIPTVDLKQDSF
ncbi:MAG: hypothetical protein AAB439_02740 [Patescibacteria group bacterium]